MRLNWCVGEASLIIWLIVDAIHRQATICITSDYSANARSIVPRVCCARSPLTLSPSLSLSLSLSRSLSLALFLFFSPIEPIRPDYTFRFGVFGQ